MHSLFSLRVVRSQFLDALFLVSTFFFRLAQDIENRKRNAISLLSKMSHTFKPEIQESEMRKRVTQHTYR